MVWVLVLVAFGVIGVLIYSYIREEDEGDTSGDLPSTLDGTETIEREEVLAEKAEITQYVTIYEYTEYRAKKHCACCDGENDVAAQMCSICGSPI